MQRRALLATVGAALGSAGCLSTGDPPADASTGDDAVTSTDDPATTDERTPSADVPDATDVFDGFDCPSFDDGADRTVCYHTATDDAVVLTAEPEVFDPYGGDDDVETLSFVLYNRSEWTVGFNPYDWSLHRFEGEGEWTKVGPDGPVPEPLSLVESGETYRWAVPSASGPSPSDDARRLDRSLSPGVYAFGVTGGYQVVDDSTDAPAERTEFVALARVETAIPLTGSEQTTAQG
ncbi:hypothetical protein EGH21_12450 [Halomicroarcula sp. F13]|uniref:Uncharacterized protein n=1 Tax=Haloarcula rubra TaxID=2487747 RepID=A0AAW4PRL4_9EURY|nr:hypothetical protein [Halomicroarcula rubra]MBX0323841.1 hypothetical protein [Halomicroarcula rubra]